MRWNIPSRSPPGGRALRELRTAAALAPVRPAYAAGMRGALAVSVPLVAGTVLGLDGGLWMSIAGFNIVLNDGGGSYRSRAVVQMTIAGASATLAAAATLAGVTPVLAVPLAFVVATGAGLARVWGAAGASVGLPVLLTFLAALAFPPAEARASEALARAGFILLGSGWGMLLTLALWPLRPDRPARHAVARCYRDLAAYVAEIGRLLLAKEPRGADRLAGRAASVRRAVERTRDLLASARRGRPGESVRGAQLLQLYEIADQLFLYADAAAETLEIVERADREDADQRAFTTQLAGLASTLQLLADDVEAEKRAEPSPVAWSGTTLRRPAASDAGSTRDEEAHYADARILLDRMVRLAGRATAIAAGLEKAREVAPGRSEQREDRDAAPTARTMLRAVLAPESLLLRYSLRLGLVTAFAVALTALVRLPYGHWVTLTAIVILQPYSGVTTQRAIQRVLGTVLGGVVAAGLSGVLRGPDAILAAVALFVALCIALLPVSYAVFSVFVTPAFVLLVELGVGDSSLAWVRVLNTVLGGVLALAASRLLWPEPEWNRLPLHLAHALRASREHLRTMAHVLTAAPEVDRKEPLREARREIGLAAINAEESFQRLLVEYRGSPARLEPVMALLGYIRHFANSVAALALVFARRDPDPIGVQQVREVAAMAGPVLEDLAASLLEDREPAPLPEHAAFADPDASPLLGARLDRLLSQLEVLHNSVSSWTAGNGVVEDRERERSRRPAVARRSGAGA